MDPEEAVRAHLDLHSSESIAIHFETFNLAEDRFDELVTDLHAAMRQHAIAESNFLALKPGQTYPFSTSAQSPMCVSTEDRSGNVHCPDIAS
jgi:succinylglutamate desuccinylase